MTRTTRVAVFSGIDTQNPLAFYVGMPEPGGVGPQGPSGNFSKEL